MDDLFGPELILAKAERRLRKEGHVTHQLAALKLDLEDLWQKPLDAKLRARVQKIFKYWEDERQFTLILPEGTSS